MRRDYSAEQAGERRGEGGDEAAAEQHEAPQDQRVDALLRGAEAERGEPRAGLLGAARTAVPAADVEVGAADGATGGIWGDMFPAVGAAATIRHPCSAGNVEPRGRAVYGTRTSFPRTWPDSLAPGASAARANGNASCTGRWKRPASMSAATSGSVSPARSAPAPPVTITPSSPARKSAIVATFAGSPVSAISSRTPPWPAV